MSRIQWIAFGAVLLALGAGIVYAQPVPNCGRNMLCQVRTLIATGDATAVHFHSTAPSGEGAFNLPQGARIYFDDPTNSTYAAYDGTNVNIVGAPLTLGAFNITTTGRFCTTAACNTNYITNDGFGTMNLIGAVGGTGNWSTVGSISTDDYLIPKTGLKNTGTGAACSSNTGAVCVNDTGGLAVGDGSGNTVATVSAAGLATVVDFKATATTTVGTITLNTGTGTATVRSGAKCVCTDSTANASVQCTVVTTTLTATGTGSDVIVYFCGG